MIVLPGAFGRLVIVYIPALPGNRILFTSVVVGSILQGNSLPIAIDRAVQFITTAIRLTMATIIHVEKELLERVLSSLNMPVV